MTTIGDLGNTPETFGAPVTTTERSRLYAFAVSRGGTPKIFEFDITSEGLAALSNLVRSEDVIKVVKGVEARFTVESVVSLVADELELIDKLPIRMSELHGQTQASE